MPKRIDEDNLAEILAVVAREPGGASRQDIAKALPQQLPPRTLQFRLRNLVQAGRLTTKGEGRAVRYLPVVPGATPGESAEAPFAMPISAAGSAIQQYLRRPPESRKPVSYNRELLDSYRPNVQFYLSPEERALLRATGTSPVAAEPAGTYAKQILGRLLIDLSWNSSRLEGNTYSLLDTKRLIEFGQEAQGRDRLEAQMILNHKDAIEFLVNAADEIGFNRYTILNLHAILANNLLHDEGAAGRLRNIAVAIERSAYLPLAVPQQIEEYFDQILTTATAIEDPFEQAFFIMVQLITIVLSLLQLHSLRIAAGSVSQPASPPA